MSIPPWVIAAAASVAGAASLVNVVVLLERTSRLPVLVTAAGLVVGGWAAVVLTFVLASRASRAERYAADLAQYIQDRNAAQLGPRVSRETGTR